MQQGQNSRTAIATAAMRAAHRIFDEPPYLVDDKYALSLAGFESEDDLINLFSTRAQVGFKENRAYFSLRHRYVEDELLNVKNSSGARQYIILGSGLDSFAYRNDIDNWELKVFEVDYPTSLQWKQKRLSELAIQIPVNVRYIPIDFNNESISDVLEKNGVSFQEPIFLSWLGVTLYLNQDSVFSLLSDLVRVLSAGSAIIFDYVLREKYFNEKDREIVNHLSQVSSSVGEPWLSSFDPQDLENRLLSIGFKFCRHFTKSMAVDQYFKNRSDNLALPGYPQLIKAGM